MVSYSRATFLQTGDGHFSPIGGVDAKRDMALILDTVRFTVVEGGGLREMRRLGLTSAHNTYTTLPRAPPQARFKYPPHWVPISMLYESMSAVDKATGQPRGFLRLATEEWPDSVLFTLDLRSGPDWRAAAEFGHEGAPAVVEVRFETGARVPVCCSAFAEPAMCFSYHQPPQIHTEPIPQSLARAGQAEPAAILQRLVAAAPLPSVAGFVAMRFASSLCAKDRCVPHAVRGQVLEELRATPLYQVRAAGLLLGGWAAFWGGWWLLSWGGGGAGATFDHATARINLYPPVLPTHPPHTHRWCCPSSSPAPPPPGWISSPTSSACSCCCSRPRPGRRPRPGPTPRSTPSGRGCWRRRRFRFWSQRRNTCATSSSTLERSWQRAATTRLRTAAPARRSAGAPLTARQAPARRGPRWWTGRAAAGRTRTAAAGAAIEGRRAVVDACAWGGCKLRLVHLCFAACICVISCAIRPYIFLGLQYALQSTADWTGWTDTDLLLV